jgi:hypothetical protein
MIGWAELLMEGKAQANAAIMKDNVAGSDRFTVPNANQSHHDDAQSLPSKSAQGAPSSPSHAMQN